MIKIKLPSGEEIRNAIELAETNPNELTDRELWILQELGGDLL